MLNASGVLLHTNLGRARMDRASAGRAAEAAAECCDLEFSLAAGSRGDRYGRLRDRLSRLVGAEDALVVNNNAAAVLLAVHALGAAREVVVARAELVEIGGSFRIPEIVRAAGATLRLVGAANVTRAEDYRAALGPGTGLLLKVHQSNFRWDGETSAPPTSEVAAVARAAGVPLVEDLGSGCLFDLEPYGLPPEPTVRATLAAGADVVTFSGDKLLGGPQSGLIVGGAALLARLRKDDLLRALRVGKVVDALIVECLDRYLEGAEGALPFVRMLRATVAELEACGRRVVAAVGGTALTLELVPSRAQAGAGACPEHTLDSRALAASAPGLSPDELKARLLAGEPPVVGRVEAGRLLLDLRSLLPEDLDDLAGALRSLDGALSGSPGVC